MVDKEDGNAQSIEAQQNGLRVYAVRENIKIVKESVDSDLPLRRVKYPPMTEFVPFLVPDLGA